MQTGKQEGMTIMDDEIMKLYKGGKVSAREAHLKANDKKMFEQFLRD